MPWLAMAGLAGAAAHALTGYQGPDVVEARYPIMAVRSPGIRWKVKELGVGDLDRKIRSGMTPPSAPARDERDEGDETKSASHARREPAVELANSSLGVGSAGAGPSQDRTRRAVHDWGRCRGMTGENGEMGGWRCGWVGSAPCSSCCRSLARIPGTVAAVIAGKFLTLGNEYKSPKALGQAGSSSISEQT